MSNIIYIKCVIQLLTVFIDRWVNALTCPALNDMLVMSLYIMRVYFLIVDFDPPCGKTGLIGVCLARTSASLQAVSCWTASRFH